MANFKKFFCLILTLVIVLPVFSSCSMFDGTITLRVMSWADYMDYSLLKEFEDNYTTSDGKKIKILFETVEKPEVMAVKIEKGKEEWDVMCPSESVLERLMKQNLLKSIDTSEKNMPNYNKYVSTNIKKRSDAVEDNAKKAIEKIISTGSEEQKENFKDFEMGADYSVGYMWGNFGILYNTKMMEGDMDLLKSWAALWNTDKFKGKMMMKNGPRESFAIGIIYVYRDALNELYNENITEYKKFLEEIFIINGDKKSITCNNKTYQLYKGNDLIAKVEEALRTQKDTAGTVYEMDDGKDEMIRGNFAMDMAWNGDGVYAMGETTDPNMLDFIIPDEGSNFWIDSWVIPKYSKNQEIAEMFIDFMCSPSSSIRNMEYVGYTSVTAGQEVLNWAVLNGGNFDNPIDASYFFGDVSKFNLTDEEGREIYKDSIGNEAFTTLAYMGDDGKLYDRETDELITNKNDFSIYEVDVNNAFVNTIQYPSAEEYERCGIMLGYSDYSDEILEMWTRIKGAKIALYILIALSVLIAAAIVLGTLYFIKNRKYNKKIITTKKQTPAKKV